jgi:hypothetical protein
VQLSHTANAGQALLQRIQQHQQHASSGKKWNKAAQQLPLPADTRSKQLLQHELTECALCISACSHPDVCETSCASISVRVVSVQGHVSWKYRIVTVVVFICQAEHWPDCVSSLYFRGASNAVVPMLAVAPKFAAAAAAAAGVCAL